MCSFWKTIKAILPTNCSGEGKLPKCSLIVCCFTQQAALGGFILFFGFLAFNGGSQAAIAGAGDADIVALSILNTVLGGE